MFFHEYALTPQIFQKEYCESDDERRLELLYFLKKLRHNGLVANINKNQWLRLVLEYRNDLSPMYRDKLSKAFEYLQDHHRIVEHETILREHLSSEEEWLDVMEEEDRVKPYAAIVFTGKIKKPNEKTYTIDEIAESELIEDQRTGYELYHTKENIEAYIKDFLLYAKKLTIIDPYFTYNKRDVKRCICMLNFSENGVATDTKTEKSLSTLSIIKTTDTMILTVTHTKITGYPYVSVFMKGINTR